MKMVFQVKDTALLDKVGVGVGEEIRFRIESENGRFVASQSPLVCGLLSPSWHQRP